MRIRVLLFNGFLALLLLAAGCGTTEERKRRKEMSSMAIFLESESRRDSGKTISVIRSAPIQLNVSPEPLLTDQSVLGATVEDQLNSFVIRVRLDRQSSWLLERATVTHRGRHYAVYASFGEERWLAAPVITTKNSTGNIVFTPDCTREEAERFVRGLNNKIRKAQQKENWPFEPMER